MRNMSFAREICLLCFYEKEEFCIAKRNSAISVLSTGEYFFLFYLNIEMYENQKKRHSFVKLKNVTKENTLF